MKSLQKKSKIAQIYYYDPQSAGTNMQSLQSESTPRRLTNFKFYSFIFCLPMYILYVHTRPSTYPTKLSLLNLDEKKSKVCTVSLQCSVPSHDFFLNVWSDIVSDLRHRSCEGIRWLRWHAAIRRIGRL